MNRIVQTIGKHVYTVDRARSLERWAYTLLAAHADAPPGCWVWRHEVDLNGYPVIPWPGKTKAEPTWYIVQDIVWILTHEQRLSAHATLGHDRLCVNPLHVRLLGQNRDVRVPSRGRRL